MNPYVILGLVIAWVASVAGVGWWQNDAGHTAERDTWQKQAVQNAADYAKQLKDLRGEKDAALAVLQGKLDESTQAYEAKREEAKREKEKSDRFAADVRAGRIVLRDPGAGKACSGGGPASATAASGSDGGAAQPGQLSGALSEFLWGEASRADEVITALEAQLTLAQGAVTGYYEKARSCR